MTKRLGSDFDMDKYQRDFTRNVVLWGCLFTVLEIFSIVLLVAGCTYVIMLVLQHFGVV